MSQPGPAGFDVVPRKLHDEADMWREQAVAMGTVAHRIGEEIKGDDLHDSWVPLGEFIRAYREVTAVLQQRCQQGEAAMHQIEETLHTVANGYRATDEALEQDYKKVRPGATNRALRSE